MTSEFQNTIDEVRATLHVFEADLKLLEEHVLAIKAMQRQEWISVNDRLPDFHVDVLILTIAGKKRIGNISKCDPIGWCYPDAARYYDYPDRGVTHWMPLPNPPKE